MKEPVLRELQGTSILTKDFFNRIIRRIECIKPLAGSGVSITQEDNGITISASGGISAVTYTLNVCSNGTPATIIVYGPEL